jgi:hypothetical protein
MLSRHTEQLNFINLSFFVIFKPCRSSALLLFTVPLMANPNNVVCQFTEDAFAAEDRICEWPSCRAEISKGQPCYYVHTIEPGKAGCYVCAACYAHYQTRSVMSMKRPTGESIINHDNLV